MDKRMYNTWMMVTSLVLAVIGLVFILVSIFNDHAGTSVLIAGMFFEVLANLFNIIRMRQNKKNQEE